jgi:hypothetical protein
MGEGWPARNARIMKKVKLTRLRDASDRAKKRIVRYMKQQEEDYPEIYKVNPYPSIEERPHRLIVLPQTFHVFQKTLSCVISVLETLILDEDVGQKLLVAAKNSIISDVFDCKSPNLVLAEWLEENNFPHDAVMLREYFTSESPAWYKMLREIENCYSWMRRIGWLPVKEKK